MSEFSGDSGLGCGSDNEAPVKTTSGDFRWKRWGSGRCPEVGRPSASGNGGT